MGQILFNLKYAKAFNFFGLLKYGISESQNIFNRLNLSKISSAYFKLSTELLKIYKNLAHYTITEQGTILENTTCVQKFKITLLSAIAKMLRIFKILQPNKSLQRTARGGFFEIYSNFKTMSPLIKFSGTLVPSLPVGGP